MWESGFHPLCFDREMRDAFTYKGVYTGSGLHTDGLTQRDDFTKGCFYLQAILHRDTFNTEMLVHTGALRYKYFYREMILPRKLLDAGGFSHRCLYTEILLHRCFYTPKRLQYTQRFTHTFFYAEIPLHAHTVHGRRFYMQILLHGDVYFVHSFLHTRMLCHRDAFHHHMLLNRDIFT